MRTFGFFSKIDPEEEILNKVKANNIEEALILFVSYKQLTIDDFLNIYDVKEI